MFFLKLEAYFSMFKSVSYCVVCWMNVLKHIDSFWGDPVCFLLQVVVPPKELILAGKDAAAEYDELAEPQDFQDDPEWVLS